ncbi:MAG: 2-(1,2-epoxy-1,2-dihydrophenyl)acetyl-CoA isomerase PaaG [Candidatus Binatia bacterium]
MGTILYEVDEGVGRITLNRPEVLNSFNTAMARELQTALDGAGKDERVRALLLTGGGRAFCAGQDLDEVKPREGKPPVELSRILDENYNPIVRRIRALEKLVVCAVNGVAAGAGANVALACDLVLASSKASFIQAFAAIGLVPDSGGTFFLPRLVGVPRAAAMMYLGDRVSAQQALEIGMIYKVCEPEALAEEALRLARHLATRPTRGLGLAKRALNRSLSNDLDAQLDLERDLQSEAGRTHDYDEGVRAFLEKREPKFQGS